jgi:hypothetical protein
MSLVFVFIALAALLFVTTARSGAPVVRRPAQLSVT